MLCLPLVTEDRKLIWTRSEEKTQQLGVAAELALKGSFDAFPYPTLPEMSALALRHSLVLDQVRVWFMVQRLHYGISWNGEEICEVRAKLCGSQPADGGGRQKKTTREKEKSSSRVNEAKEEEQLSSGCPSQTSLRPELVPLKLGPGHPIKHTQLWNSFWQNQTPSRKELLRLHRETGLKMKIISKWFTNRRSTARRQKPEPVEIHGQHLPLPPSQTQACVGAPLNHSGGGGVDKAVGTLNLADVKPVVSGCDRRAEKEQETPVEAANRERTLGIQGRGAAATSDQTEERSEAVVDEKHPVTNGHGGPDPTLHLSPTSPEFQKACRRMMGPRLKKKTLGQVTFLRHTFLTNQWPDVVEYNELERLTGLPRRDLTQWFGDMRYHIKKFKVGWMTATDQERILAKVRAQSRKELCPGARS